MTVSDAATVRLNPKTKWALTGIAFVALVLLLVFTESSIGAFAMFIWIIYITWNSNNKITTREKQITIVLFAIFALFSLLPIVGAIIPNYYAWFAVLCISLMILTIARPSMLYKRNMGIDKIKVWKQRHSAGTSRNAKPHRANSIMAFMAIVVVLGMISGPLAPLADAAAELTETGKQNMAFGFWNEFGMLVLKDLVPYVDNGGLSVAGILQKTLATEDQYHRMSITYLINGRGPKISVKSASVMFSGDPPKGNFIGQGHSWNTTITMQFQDYIHSETLNDMPGISPYTINWELCGTGGRDYYSWLPPEELAKIEEMTLYAIVTKAGAYTPSSIVNYLFHSNTIYSNDDMVYAISQPTIPRFPNTDDGKILELTAKSPRTSMYELKGTTCPKLDVLYIFSADVAYWGEYTDSNGVVRDLTKPAAYQFTPFVWTITVDNPWYNGREAPGTWQEYPSWITRTVADSVSGAFHKVEVGMSNAASIGDAYYPGFGLSAFNGYWLWVLLALIPISLFASWYMGAFNGLRKRKGFGWIPERLNKTQKEMKKMGAPFNSEQFADFAGSNSGGVVINYAGKGRKY